MLVRTNNSEILEGVRLLSFHFLLMIPLAMSVWFGKWKARIAYVAAGPRTHRLDHWYSPSSLRISAQKILCTISQTLYTAA